MTPAWDELPIVEQIDAAEASAVDNDVVATDELNTRRHKTVKDGFSGELFKMS